MKTNYNGVLFCVIITMCSLVLITTDLQAQLEIKLDPILLATQQPNFEIEFILKEKFGIETSLVTPRRQKVEFDYEELKTNVFNQIGYQIKLAGKYYFKPETKGDKFYGSAYVKSNLDNFVGKSEFFTENMDYRQTSYETGLGLGYKKAILNRIILELSTGLAAVLDNEKDYVNLDFTDTTKDFEMKLVGNVMVGYRINECKKDKVEEELITIE